MKRIIYISLMILLAVMVTVSLYYCLIYGIAVNRLINYRYIVCFTDMALSSLVLTAIALLGALVGLRAGKKWWQIIYVDRVYYFDKSLAPQAVTTQKPRVPRKAVKKTTK